MKKIINGIGYFTSFLLIIGFLFKAQHWPGAGPIAILSVFLFCALIIPFQVYFALFESQGNKGFAVLSAVLSALITLGLAFKMFHMPGAGPLIVLGLFFLSVLLVPILIVFLRKKTSSGKEKTMILVGGISVALLSLGVLFKLQHWPGASIMLILGVFLFAFFFLPLHYMVKKEFGHQRIHGIFQVVFAFCLVISLFLFNVSRNLLNSFVIVEDSINEGIKSSEARISTTLECFNQTNQESAQLKAKKVKELSDDMYNHVEKLKKHLMRECDKVPMEVPDDSLSLLKVNAKDNYDIPSYVLIGDPQALRTGPWSATELKAKLSLYRNDILSMYDENARESANKTLGVKTEDKGQMPDGYYEYWETEYFYHSPVATVITTLSLIQSDIRNTESVTLEYLYNNAKSNE